MPLAMSKLAGYGNDFLLVDCMARPLGLDPRVLARHACHRQLGVGADGLILIEPAKGAADFAARLFNRDGSDAEFSGNGGRCIARFGHELGLGGAALSFETLAGLIDAEIEGAVVRLVMPTPHGLELGRRIDVHGREIEVHIIDTGVPHAVLFVDNVEDTDVVGLGRAIRRHRAFPRGANVDFVAVGPDRLRMRTYERGVEDETLACGTGSVAAAVVAHLLGRTAPPVEVETRSGGILEVTFAAAGHAVTGVMLTGATERICSVEVTDEWLAARFCTSAQAE
jgi:diaminopimelate epimerase